MTEIDVSGCKFQTDCIEYKDISYLKIMPICAIHELSIACHDKVNKCKYYKLYTQLKRLEAENEKLKEELNRYKEMETKGLEEFKDVGGCWGCGLQLQLEQDIKDLKKYGQENVELLQETAKLKEKLEKILNFCKTLEDVKEEYMRIQLIKEIIEDKKDIHYYLEQYEATKDECTSL